MKTQSPAPTKTPDHAAPDPASPPELGLDARRAAMVVVDQALAKRGGFEQALNEPPFSRLAGSDRAFARHLASSTLRGLGAIDHLLDKKLTSPPPPAIRSVLRLGAAQILFGLAPAFAAVSTSLALVEGQVSLARFKGLINAVLRGLDREGGAGLLDTLDPETFAPSWLVARWRAHYGMDRARGLCAAIRLAPPTDLTPRDPTAAAAIAADLDGTVLPTGSVRTHRRGEVKDWPGYLEGGWWVQDVAAALPARLLQLQALETALDMCAAPGGKTLQMAAAGAAVTAADRSAKRLRRVQDNLDRAQLTAQLVTADGETWSFDTEFDAVLLDAPCSSTGTFRRHPDVLWVTRPGDIAALAEVQARLLDGAARAVRPGGRLVYSVCSLEPEEGEQQIADFLLRHPDFVRAPIDAKAFALAPEAVSAMGEVRLTPILSESPPGGQDGFFAARLIRQTSAPTAP